MFQPTNQTAHLYFVDNHDSFTANLLHALSAVGANVVCRGLEDATLEEASDPHFDAVVIGPGPGNHEAGARHHRLILGLRDKALLGICLGHQAIATAYGARLVHADTPMHGRTSQIGYRADPLFADLPNPFTAMRYHSLRIELAPGDHRIEVLAHSKDDRAIMAYAIPERSCVGLQFHPESFATPEGRTILSNWLRMVKDTKANSKPSC